MVEKYIRCSAIGIIKKGNKILVFEGRDESRDLTFYRPLGGGIEFGERSHEALKREFMEEMGLEIDVLDFLGVNENIFTYEGQKGHGNMFLYECKFKDKSQYDIEEFVCHEDDGVEFKALWIDIEDIKNKHLVCYPEGIEKIL